MNNIIRYALVGIVAVLVLLSAGLFFWLQSTLPDYEKTLRSENLGHDVTIVRDEHGVPHITATTFEDAAFAMGYVQAQDRLWQMEMMRRAVNGRTAEVMGKDLLSTDLAYRVHSALPKVAAKTIPRIDPDIQMIFQAFADGVNLAIETGEATSSPEWSLLGVPTEPWTASDSNNFMTINSETATDGGNELFLMEIQNELSETSAKLVLRELPPEFPTLYRDFRPEPEETSEEASPVGVPEAEKTDGTNFFVVGPTRTNTGMPILAVDPHLPTHAPAPVYPLTITLPDDFIAGAAWVGSPSIPFGQNSHIAWGMTHLYADTFDYIVERIDPEKPDNYLTTDGSVPFEIEEVSIPVKDAADEIITIRSTHNGIVVSDPIGDNVSPDSIGLSEEFALIEEKFGPGHVVVRKHVAVEVGQTTMQSIVKMSRAHSWDEFRDALRDYEWTNNVVFADIEGNIGVQMAARLPDRKKVNDWDGQRLARGWLGEGEWAGYIPFDDLPYIFNPDNGWIADSNSRAADASIPFRVSDNYSPPWRVVRSYEMLEAEDQHDMSSIASIQTDTQSAQAEYLLQRLSKFPMRTDRARSALELLAAWDYEMSPEQAEPLIYSTIELALQQEIVNPNAGPAAGTYPNVFRIANALENESDWCDRASTDETETCADIVNIAVELALDALEREHGSNMENWAWKDEHVAEFPAFFSWSYVPVLDDLTRTRIITPGGDNTLNQAAADRSSRPDDMLSELEFIQGSGGTYRLVADLSSPKNSIMSFAPGISGNAYSQYWDNMAESWAAKQYVPLLPTSDTAGQTTTIYASKD
ncbi:MAG: penicillin acylase family protein [Pseudomonadota bacterium]